MTKKIVITSSSNKIFKDLISLQTSKGIQKSGFFLLSGQKLVDEALSSKKYKTQIDTIVIPSKLKRNFLSEKHASEPIKTIELGSPLFAELDQFGTDYPILKMKNPPIEKAQTALPLKNNSETFLGLVLPLQNPENMGAAIRSAAAFGANVIFLTKDSSNPLLPKSVRASGLAIYEVDLRCCNEMSDLNFMTIPRIALDASGSTVSEFKFPTQCLIVVGKEGEGIKSLDIEKFQLLRIPISNYVESLNATVAISIVLYVWQSQRSL